MEANNYQQYYITLRKITSLFEDILHDRASSKQLKIFLGIDLSFISKMYKLCHNESSKEP